jgi:NADPH oxidase
MRVIGDFTKGVSKALGCDFGGRGAPKDASVVKTVNDQGVDPSLQRVLPRVYVDGPFGSASEDVFKFEVAVLCGAGIGVTPFASILKSIWYRMNYPKGKTRLRKVYFFWICRDFGSLEWFRSLLLAIEQQDMDHAIEIHTVRLPHHPSSKHKSKLTQRNCSISPPRSAPKMQQTS